MKVNPTELFVIEVKREALLLSKTCWISLPKIMILLREVQLLPPYHPEYLRLLVRVILV
jgi:hypothetical protein